MKQTGFTLMELMLTVIVLAILVSIAVPTYISTTERARAREAIATLNAIRAAEASYSAERRSFIALSTASTDDTWRMVGLEDPHNNGNRSWNYAFTAGGVGTATRWNGPNNGEQITIDAAGTLNDAGFTP